MAAGFISEWWPASNRNGGRLHVGIPGRNKSESAGCDSEKFSQPDAFLDEIRGDSGERLADEPGGRADGSLGRIYQRQFPVRRRIDQGHRAERPGRNLRVDERRRKDSDAERLDFDARAKLYSGLARTIVQDGPQ